MAKKKQTVEVIERDPVIDADSDDELDDLTGEDRDALKALLELEGAAEARWKVFRCPPLQPGKAAGYCDTLSSSELSMEEIRARFGRGKYRVQGTRSTGQFIAQKTFDIATDAPSSAQPTTAAPVNSGFEAFLASQEKAAERRRELLTLALPAAIAALPAVLQALRPASADPITLLAGLKQLTPEPPKQPDMTEFMFKVLEFAKRTGASKEGGSSWIDVVKDGISELAPLLVNKLQASQPQSLAPTAQLSAPPIAQPVLTKANGAPLDQSPEEQTMLKLIAWARHTLAFLVTKAAANKDAGLYADYVLDNVPPGVNILEFAKYLNAPNWWEVLQQFDKNVAPYQGWFAQFRDFLIEAVEEQFGELPNTTPNAEPQTITEGHDFPLIDDTDGGAP